MDIKDFCKLYDLQIYDTGGGCLALTNNSNWSCGGFYWLMTDVEDARIPDTPDNPAQVGLYDNNSGDLIAWWTFSDMFKAIEFMRHTHF